MTDRLFHVYFLYLFFFLYTTFGYNNIIMVHLFSLLFMQTCPSVVVHKLWIDRFSCLVALWLMCFHGLQSRSYLFDFLKILFISNWKGILGDNLWNDRGNILLHKPTSFMCPQQRKLNTFNSILIVKLCCRKKDVWYERTLYEK